MAGVEEKNRTIEEEPKLPAIKFNLIFLKIKALVIQEGPIYIPYYSTKEALRNTSRKERKMTVMLPWA